MSRLSRRDFLARSGAAFAGMGLLGPSSVYRDERGYGQAPNHRWDLEAHWINLTLDGTPTRLRSYNGTIPGPLITARPGELLRVRVKNRLTPYDSSNWNGDHNVPHYLDTTNLHLHGLEVVPHLFEPVGTSNATARMIAIRPGEEKEYAIQLADDQPSGLYWYHPHHHGSTVVQAVSGMAGALIVRGEIDEVPEIKAAREILLVAQDIGLFPSETEEGVWTYEPKQNAIWNTLESQVFLQGKPAPWLQGGFTTGDYKLRYFLLNGQPIFKEVHNQASPQEPIGTQLGVPRFVLRPGEVVRFRMLNANSDNLMPIVFQDHELYLLALDGINFPEPRVIPKKGIGSADSDPQLLLAPANRAEFLLQATAKKGVYSVVQLEQNQQFLRSSRRILAEIEVAGEPVSMGLPDKLPIPVRHYPLIRPEEIKRRRKIVFSMQAPGVLNPIVGLDFMINNQLYDEQAIALTADRGTAEEWYLIVPDQDNGGTEGHPFHIHVNSFEVITAAGVEQPSGTIMDTLWLPKNTQSVVRMKFRQWTGKAVYHCHILPHEDTGMMQNFLIR